MTKTFIFPVHALAYEKMVEKAMDGTMPTLKKLMDRGSYGICTSVHSTASPVDYTSMLTGTTPVTHGIDDFQTNTYQGSPFAHDPGSETPTVIPAEELEKTRLYTSYDVPVPWVWDLLPEQRTMQFGIFSPTTYPAPKLPNNGVWVSGFWSKPTTYLRDNVAACNDQDIRDELMEIYPDYHITPLFAVPPIYPDVDNVKDYLEAVVDNNIRQSQRLHEARLHIFNNHEWDIFLTEDGICDNTQHLVWPRNPTNPLHTELDDWLEDKDLLGRFLRHIDDLLATYLDTLPDDTNIIIISAHGQQETEHEEYMHDNFRNLYKYGIWDVPTGWQFQDEKPDWSPQTRAEHSYRGGYVVAGPGFTQGGESDPISCMDFAAIMLSLYDRDIPTHIDGRVPTHLMA